MKNELKKIVVILLLIFFTFEILTSSAIIIPTVIFSFNIWKNSIFPSLFPFFILAELLINYGFVEIISKLMHPIMKKLFKLSGTASFIFVMSIISGFPSNAKYTKELYLKNLINKNEAEKIMMFTHFSNPLFILGTISVLFLNNKASGLLIMFCHYISNIIIGLIFRNYHCGNKCVNKNINNKISLQEKHETETFGIVITNAIKNAIDTLLLILGIVTICLIFTTIINNVFNLNNFYKSILNSTVEMTQGLKYISDLNISLKAKSILSAMIISFGGISVHIQVLSIISDIKIKYLPFFIARLVHTIIAGILVYVLFNPWMTIIS